MRVSIVGFGVLEDDEEAWAVCDDVDALLACLVDGIVVFGAGLAPDVFDAEFCGFLDDAFGDGWRCDDGEAMDGLGKPYDQSLEVILAGLKEMIAQTKQEAQRDAAS